MGGEEKSEGKTYPVGTKETLYRGLYNLGQPSHYLSTKQRSKAGKRARGERLLSNLRMEGTCPGDIVLITTEK